MIPGLFLLGTLIFGYLYIAGPSSKTISYGEESTSGKVSYSRLQNLKRQTAVHLDLKKQQALLNQNGDRPDLDPGKDRKNNLHDTSIDRKLGPAARDVDNRRSHDALTLDQRMDEFLAKKQAYEKLEKSQRLAYVKMFISEARNMGYEVVVDQEMQIVSVEKVGDN